MLRGKLSEKRLPHKVWRISASVPLGAYVDPGTDGALPERVAVEPPERSTAHRGWQDSSFELLNGVEVSEEDPSTVPAELFDEWFKPSK